MIDVILYDFPDLPKTIFLLYLLNMCYGLDERAKAKSQNINLSVLV